MGRKRVPNRDSPRGILIRAAKFALVRSMQHPGLTGAQKTKLRGVGQTMADAAWLGREGVTPAFVAELNRLLGARELVKLRFSAGQDRHERAALTEKIEAEVGCQCVGAVGHTALFWRAPADGSTLLK